MKSKNKQILKVTALYVIWNLKSVKCPASISDNPVPLCEFSIDQKLGVCLENILWTFKVIENLNAILKSLFGTIVQCLETKLT